MITIQITNVEDIVDKKKGWFVAHVLGSIIDLEPRVEAVIIEKLREAFAEQGVEANISQTRDPELATVIKPEA
ncbi:MAG TPA: hypothetical protein VGM88_31195 [Kofleriaceae bacterium]|jgi:hypothetical protein